MKEAYYFSHDSNARHDPKITAMRGVYGSEGYGWYWMLIEMMRESEGYKLDMQSKYTFSAFALQLQCTSDVIEQFVHDCITEFNLFEADATHFWSVSLLRRMDIRDQKSEARRKAAKARWDKEKQLLNDAEQDANNMQLHSKSTAIAMQGKERKLNKSKLKESIKDICVSDESNPYDPEFENFWSAYPPARKRDKAKTFKVWQKKTAKFDKVKMTECVQRYAADKKAIGYDGSFAKMPTSFLNAETYKDYIDGGDERESSGHSSGSTGKFEEFIIQ